MVRACLRFTAFTIFVLATILFILDMNHIWQKDGLAFSEKQTEFLSLARLLHTQPHIQNNLHKTIKNKDENKKKFLDFPDLYEIKEKTYLFLKDKMHPLLYNLPLWSLLMFFSLVIYALTYKNKKQKFCKVFY